MTKKRANHIRPGMNDAKAQGRGAGYEEGYGNEGPLSAEERQFNKKTKKRQ
ncbi:small acid-soluble spore protein O [Evansella tamaricis]|uniref:Small acid-soluble spore protein O n=1 Tax=Evansella tamaricis TaxID=2069301 RepID=A0ABS6JIU7_9BACI|nr:small acid-soluble spore protein O [Evansella tamaricis]MBU9712385.1 small acid-soluble spore protein O [Evansella tamaricis]